MGIQATGEHIVLYVSVIGEGLSDAMATDGQDRVGLRVGHVRCVYTSVGG